MSDDAKGLFHSGEEFLQLFHRGAKFTRELLLENERLRGELARVLQRQEDAVRDPTHWEGLRQELLGQIAALESERRGAEEQLAELQSENQEFARRHVEIEQENNTFANLYVASYQLHSTLSLDEVIRIISEILINLVGAEVFALYLVDDRDHGLAVSAAEGWSLERFPRVPGGSGCIGGAVESGLLHIGLETASDDPTRPIVCVPLVVQEQAVGAVAIYRLLEQKQGLGELDRELFTMLGGHAATALLAAKLYSQSERKLHTIQGFIDLLAS